jgi:hypothetical protein
MKTVYGDILSYRGRAYIVIPTNIGWKANGENVMGRGVARLFASLYPQLPKEYGRICQKDGAKTTCVAISGFDTVVIMFPVKPLNAEAPWMSWKSGATLDLIERSAKDLAALEPSLPGKNPIVVPAVGCGNGGLDLSDVKPILEKYLTSDRFILVLEESRRPHA